MISQPRHDGHAPRYFGLYPAIVTNLVDEDSLGRIELSFPFLGQDGAEVRAWATLLSPYADKNQGLMILPEKKSQVVVGFEAGDLRRPYIVGACWNGVETLPESPAEANDKRLLKTRSESLLEFDDSASPKITLKMKSGHKVVLDDSAQTVTVEHSSGHVIRFEASGAITIQANSTVELTASALNVHAPTATFDGAVNCTSLTASVSVVSPLFSQGAGNIW